MKEILSENPSGHMVSWSGLNKPAERSPKGKLREFSALTIEVGINAKRLLFIFDCYLNIIFTPHHLQITRKI